MQIQPVIRQKDTVEGRIEQVHCRSALNKYIEQMRWLINIHQSTLSLSHLSEKKRKKNLSLLSEREKEKRYFVKT
jgi:hypothetical protein